MNAYQDQKRILNIINSCNNDFHFESVDKLIELFEYKYYKWQRFDSLMYDLIERRLKRWDEIHVNKVAKRKIHNNKQKNKIK